MRAMVSMILLLVSCATVAPPLALIEARGRLEQAARSDAAKRDAGGLREAQDSLERATSVYESEPGSRRAEDAAIEALANVHRWELMVQVRTFDDAMAKATVADALIRPLQTGQFSRRSDSEAQIGALGAAVGALGEVRPEHGSVRLRFAAGALFEHGERELRLPARARLEQAGEAVQRYSPDARVRVVANAEGTAGSDLALERAAKVREALVASGVPGQNITATNRTGPTERLEIVIEPLDVPRAR
jgi:outer membrane protein OmpA-like peptidoglycan-associated protein